MKGELPGMEKMKIHISLDEKGRPLCPACKVAMKIDLVLDVMEADTAWDPGTEEWQFDIIEGGVYETLTIGRMYCLQCGYEIEEDGVNRIVAGEPGPNYWCAVCDKEISSDPFFCDCGSVLHDSCRWDGHGDH